MGASCSSPTVQAPRGSVADRSWPPIDRGRRRDFVALDHKDALWEPIQPDDERSNLYAVIPTPGGTALQEPDGPCLKEQRVKPRARVQLRYVGFGCGAWRFGIDAHEEQILERIVPSANGNIAHQLLGFPRTVQDDPGRAWEVSLLHLVDDWRLEFSLSRRRLGSLLPARSPRPRESLESRHAVDVDLLSCRVPLLDR
jgi:hypothetical protein